MTTDPRTSSSRGTGSNAGSTTGEDAANTPRVHFSQGGLGTGGGTPPAAAALAPMLIPMGLIVVPIGLLAMLDRFPWMPFPARITLVVVLVLAAFWLVVPRIVKAYKRGNDIRGLPMALEPETRINVICWNDQRHELEPTLDDVAFEPEIFRARLPDKLPEPIARFRREKPTAARNIQGFGTAVLWLLFYLPLVLNTAAWAGLVVLAVTLLVALWFFRRPTYVRLVPGRLDVLRYPTFGGANAKPETDSIDRRTEAVRLDLKNGRLFVGDWCRDTLPQVRGTNPDRIDPAKHTVSLWLIADRNAAARAMLRACISTADAPSAGQLNEAAIAVSAGSAPG